MMHVNSNLCKNFHDQKKARESRERQLAEIKQRDDAIRQDEREKVLDLIIKEAQTAREENRKIGRATIDDAGKEYRRGCAVGNKEIGEYAESLRSGVKAP
jgi:hypothetical protein